MKLDEIDVALLKLLQADAKKTTKELANITHLSTTPVHERVKRLEREGFIKGYAALLDDKKIGLSLTVWCVVSLRVHHVASIEEFEKDVQKMTEAVACYHLAGTFDYLLKVLVKDMDAYQQFLSKKLSTSEHIGKVQSLFVMRTIKEFNGLPL